MLSRIVLLGIRPGSNGAAVGSCTAAAALRGLAAVRPCTSVARSHCHETAQLCSPAAPPQLNAGTCLHASAYSPAQHCGNRQAGDASHPPAEAASVWFRFQHARSYLRQRQLLLPSSSGTGSRSGCKSDRWQLPPPSRSISTHSAEKHRQRSLHAASSYGQDDDGEASPADFQASSRSGGRSSGQLRRWSAGVPSNGGMRGKGHTGEPQYDLGEVLQKLRQPPLHNDILSQQGRQAEGYEWKVLEFKPADGSERGQPSVQQVTATPESLGLAPRDISLFAADTGPGKQRATISVRGKEILFRSECCRAIIRADRAFLFPSRRQADTVKLAHALGTNIARGSNGHNGHANPFEFRVLECLLAATVSFFEGKAERLTMLTDSVLMDVMDAVGKAARSGGLRPTRVDLQQLLPIQRSLTELTADVKETSEAIEAVSNDDAALAAICLSEQPSAGSEMMPSILKGEDEEKQKAAMYRGAGLLESYQRQVQSLDGGLQELEENIDTVREVWHMSLDNTRNRTLQLNLAISVASFALMASTVPASFFGMNLHSGMEDHPHLLFYVAGGCLALSTALFFGVIAGQRYWPNNDQQQKVRDLGATRELLHHHLNDLDDILSALRSRNDPMDKKEFARLVGEAQRVSGASKGLTNAEVELLFKAFDTNRDGKIDTADAMRSRQDLARREIGRALV